jgi:hypothetical protein
MSRNVIQLVLVMSLLGGSAAIACDDAKACPMQKGLQAQKCGCEGKGDCTCKKGECKCGKCSRHRKSKVMPSLREAGVELPREARREATGGIFL